MRHLEYKQVTQVTESEQTCIILIFQMSATCSHLLGQPLAATCPVSHLQPLGSHLADTCSSGCSKWLPSGCKWLQVAAKWPPKRLTGQVAAKWLPSGCKWLQVAASGCKWLQVPLRSHCNLEKKAKSINLLFFKIALGSRLQPLAITCSHLAATCPVSHVAATCSSSHVPAVWQPLAANLKKVKSTKSLFFQDGTRQPLGSHLQPLATTCSHLAATCPVSRLAATWQPTCSHLPRQPFAAPCSPLQPLGSHLPRQPLAATWQPLAATVSHLPRQPLAATCSHLQPLGSHLQPLAATCPVSHLQPLAATCPVSHLQPLWQPLAATVSHLPRQPLAATCSHLADTCSSGCSKWLPSGCKWLQVADGASG